MTNGIVSLIFISLTILNSLFFVYLAFKKLRSFNYKEEEVFDIVLLNLALIVASVVTHCYWFLILGFFINALFVKLKLGWAYAKTLATLFASYCLFFGIEGGIFLVASRGKLYLLPLSIALVLLYVLSLSGNEFFKTVFEKVVRKAQTSRERAAAAKARNRPE